MYPDDQYDDEVLGCDDEYPEEDYERDMDELLAQQELEDFEQADEYFGSPADEMY